MEKSNATIKVDSVANWKKAANYIPDIFTVIIYTEEGKAPKIKIGDGKTKVNDLPFLNQKEVNDGILSL